MDDSSDGVPGFARGRLLFMFRRWGPLIALATAVAGGTAFAVSEVLPKEYSATSQLYVAPAANPTAALQDAVLGQNLARSYVQLAQSDVVLRRARDKVSWPDSKSFRERTQVAQVRDTSVITVSFRDRDPQRAAEIADLIANSFVEQVRALQSSLQSTTASQLDEEISSVEADLRRIDNEVSRLRAALAALPAFPQGPPADLSNQISQLESTRTARQDTLAQLVKTRGDSRLVAARAEKTVTVWEPAVAPSDPESPRVALNTIVGAIAGGLLTLTGIAMFMYMVDRITDVDEVRERLGVPALGEVPLGNEQTLGSHGLFVRDAPASPEAEAFRALRANLVFAAVDRPPRTIMVTSALGGEGKSLVAANLALAFAESGSLTVLVDADLRKAVQHRLFGLDSTVGLTDLLRETVPLADIKKFEVMPNLIVLPTGRPPLNPAEPLSSAKMLSLILNLSHLADAATVVIDTGPVLAVADAHALSTMVDGCVVVVDSARTPARSARRAVDVLSAVQARVLGVVLNKVPAEQMDYYQTYV